MRVLVVEDEPRLSRQLAEALGQAGYAVDCATDGERADFLGQTEGYDAVVLDLGLPKVDGLTVLRRWRDAGVTVPVLVLTARSSWHETVQGIDARRRRLPLEAVQARGAARAAARADPARPADGQLRDPLRRDHHGFTRGDGDPRRAGGQADRASSSASSPT